MLEFLPAIKQNKAIQNFIEQACKDKLSHAYLVITEDEMSLSQTLKAMASVIFCANHSACGNCIECIRVMSGNHANLHIYSAELDLKVAVIQELISSMALTPIENKPSVYIIDGADKMNESAQNKLLKTLEEPKDNCFILLGSTNENALLPTIKSRTKQLHVNIWQKDTLKTQLAKIAKDLPDLPPEELTQRLGFAVDMSEGSITRGMELLSNQDYYTRFFTLKELLLHLKTSQQVANYLGALGDTPQEVEVSLSILETLLNRAMRSHTHNTPDDIALRFSLPAIVNIQELIIEQYKKLKSNCAISSIEDSLLMGMLEIRYKTK